MPFGEQLADLDVLLLQCRSSQSKAFLAEAVACYRSGAYRSAIISTWIAVVFDLIGKFKELALAGDTEAQKVVDELEEMYHTNNITAALLFEKKVLERARKDFQLISYREQEDFQRLFEDRNHCAHPSLRSLEEPYQPLGELVRTHICNAVVTLLQYPPVQGRKALQTVLEAIVSDTFPTQVDQALEQYFKHSPLARARPTLIKDVIAVLTKHLLLERLPEAERIRKYTALLAVLKMYPQEGEHILQEELPKIEPRILSHEQLANLLDYLRRIPSTWYTLGAPGKSKVHMFLESGPDEQVVAMLPVILDIPVLREMACQRVATLSDEHLAQLIQQGSHLAEYFPEALKRWKQSESYEESKRLTKQFLAPFLSTDLTAEQITQIILACAGNSQLHDHFQTMRLFKTQVFPLSEAFLDQTKEAWVQFYEQFYWPRPNKLERRLGLIDEQEWLLDSIEKRYPDVIPLVTKRMQEKYRLEYDDICGEDQEDQ
ncbi:MAG: hypothetical protein JO202_16095 [Ktedonobacteraceae bacterium]|nr:hypothetical protein [Ktedonobacteraceae bacterium]